MGNAQAHCGAAAVPTELSTWRDGFNDPDLSRYVNAALAQNLDLAQAGARVDPARAGLSAATAALLPAGNVSGSATRAYQSLETPLGQVLNSTPNFDRHASVYEANLGASWELDLFGGLHRGRQAALADYQATEAGVAATLAVAAQTADIYIGVRGLQARLDVAQRQVATQQGLLSMVTLLHGKGLAAELQLQQAQGALAQAQAGVPGLEAGLVAAMNALDVMLGVPPGTHRAELSAIKPIPPAPQIADSGAPGDLLRRRPDLIVAERRLAASNARIGVAMAEYYPKFSLSGLLGSATAISGANLFTGDAAQSSGVLGLRWRLFDFGRINAQIAQAKGQQAEQLAAYRLAVLCATEDVENAFTALIKREQQAVVLTQGVDALGKARGASALAYEKGTVSLIEVLNADDSLLSASDALVQARTDAAHSAVATFKALGGGWQAGGADAGAIAVAVDSNRRHDDTTATE
ncbi:efflux transporter outer membrane subunit [Xanthomonas axonopodis]|uniref:efflux transporter outer membrane subunit n=1 Tax=Xanthomonas axonopodis TaxID=53413 RepID=UPI0020C969A9|nr:TolC family protein [Xanthomonas axonopodis]